MRRNFIKTTDHPFYCNDDDLDNIIKAYYTIEYIVTYTSVIQCIDKLLEQNTGVSFVREKLHRLRIDFTDMLTPDIDSHKTEQEQQMDSIQRTEFVKHFTECKEVHTIVMKLSGRDKTVFNSFSNKESAFYFIDKFFPVSSNMVRPLVQLFLVDDKECKVPYDLFLDK